jgi:protein involved in polysaccharide export with SLBB domain
MSYAKLIAGASSAVLLMLSAASAQVVRVPGTISNARGFGERGQRLDVQVFLRIPKMSADYLLGSNDEMKIEVVGEDALTFALQTVKISNSGEIAVPFIGRVQAADLTPTQLEAAIEARFVEQKLLKKPHVLVYITDYQAKPIYIYGEVDNPGEYMMSQQLTLMEAILMAGGVDFGADRFGYLHRRLSSGTAGPRPEGLLNHPETASPGGTVTKVDLQPMKNGGVLQPDIPLKTGDVFVVPTRPKRYFYAIGDFKVPGGFEIPAPAERSMRVSQAIAAAGGPNETAKLSHGILVRYDEHRRRVERKIDVEAILRGKGQDIPVQPNDIIFIPGSTAKTLEYGLLRSIPGAAQVSAQSSVQSARGPR